MAGNKKNYFIWAVRCIIRLTKNIFLIPEGSCRYIPTCTEYACDALKKKSVIKATILITWRVLRCNPFSKGGLDPVPENNRGSSE